MPSRPVSPHSSVDLEPIALRHAEDVQRLASHPDVGTTTNLPEPYPEDGAETWIRTARRVLEKLGVEPGRVETHEHPKWSDEDKAVRYEIDRTHWKNRSASESR